MKTELGQASQIAGKPIRRRKSPTHSTENIKAEGKYITPAPSEGDKPAPYMPTRAVTIGQMLAQNEVCYLRHMWDGGRTAFPYHPKLQTVSRYFPFAKGGPLYVDEPYWPHEVENCRKKQLAMKDMRKRYVLITPEMTLEAAQRELDLWDGQLRAKT